MSVAKASKTIRFYGKAGTCTAVIMSPSGDLWQEYEGTEGEVSGVTPDFGETRPVLYLVCTSSRAAEGTLTPSSVSYFFNGEGIAFDGEGAAGKFAGFFEEVRPSEGQPYYGLRITDNIAELAGLAPAAIRMEAAVSFGSQSDTVQATYTIAVREAAGNARTVTIMAGDGNNFVLTGKGDSCVLLAVSCEGGAEVTDGLAYGWDKAAGDGWETLEGETGQALTVREEDTDTYAEFRVRVYRDGSLFGSDIQGVLDASAPYTIDPHPFPEDGTISADGDGNGEVTLTPEVVTADGERAYDTRFLFALRDAAGTLLNDDHDTAYASYTVTRAHCVRAGGDVAVTITTED